MKNLTYYLFGILFFAVSCGTPEGETETEMEADTTMMEQPEEVDEAMETGQRNLVELAQNTEMLSTLVTAIQAAGLAETLKAEGPYTVFAPTNDAFSALPAGTLEELLKPENKEKLKSVLLYHVVAAKVMSTDLKDGMTPETVNGKRVTIKLGGSPMVNDANIVTTDILASNGVVHVIDKVMMPPK